MSIDQVIVGPLDSISSPTVQSLLTSLAEGKGIADSFKGRMYEEYTVDGKSLREWQIAFSIDIPVDLGPQECKILAGQLLTHYEEATRHFIIADAVLTALLDGKASDQQVRMEALISHYRRTVRKEPPATTLREFKELAENTTMRSTVANARIAKDFFKNILDLLTNARKICEQASIANGTMAKLVRQAD